MQRLLVLAAMITLTSGYIRTNGHQSYDGAEAYMNRDNRLQRAHVAPQNHYPIVTTDNQDDDSDEDILYWHGNLPPKYPIWYRNVEIYTDE